jgi:hypothetical protein
VAAGEKITMLKPKAYLAPPVTVLPAASLARDGAWPAGWLRYQNYLNGITVTFNNPKQAFNTSDNGEIARFPDGTDSITIEATIQTSRMQFVKWINGFGKVVKAAVVGPPAYPAMDIYHFDPNVNNQFMIGFEGFAEPDTLEDTSRLVRFFAVLCEQTANPANRADWSGPDGNLKPQLNVSCFSESTTNLTTITNATGYAPADFGPQRKAMWSNIVV